MTPREIILHTEAWIYLVLAGAIWWSASGYMRRSHKPAKHQFFLALGLVLPAALAWPWYSSLVDERREAVLAGIAEHARLERLNRIRPGERVPAFDRNTTELHKIGGRYFLVPKAYAMAPTTLLFYWIDGRPEPGRGSSVQLTNEPGKSHREQAIEMFIEVLEPDNAQRRRQWLAIRSLGEPMEIAPGLVRRKVMGEDYSLCIATQSPGMDGRPAEIVCPDTDNPPPHRDTLFARYDDWKPGMRMKVRFHVRHLKDWPAINAEIIRILNLIREEQP